MLKNDNYSVGLRIFHADRRKTFGKKCPVQDSVCFASMVKQCV